MRQRLEKYVLYHRERKAYVAFKKHTGNRQDAQDGNIWLTTNMDHAAQFSTMDYAGVIQLELENWREYTPVRVVVSYTWKEWEYAETH